MAPVKEMPVIWIQGSSCSGCSVSILNSVRPRIHTALLDEIAPGTHLNLLFHATIMAGQGEAVCAILDAAREPKEGFVLIVEGSVPLLDGACMLGERDGKEVLFADRVAGLAAAADAVIALGTCASYGGIFSAHPNVTQCVSAGELMKQRGIEKPLINVPGCPPHPDWLLGTVANVILFGIPETDAIGRPKRFYGRLIHENCPRRAHFDAGRFARKHGEEYCLYLLGCRGPLTSADCPDREWNSGVNWCIENNHPCIGCCEPEFPDATSPMFARTPDDRAPALRSDGSGGLEPVNRILAVNAGEGE